MSSRDLTRRARGFTLLELLVAVAVLGMLLVLLNQGVQFGLRAETMQESANARSGDLEVIDRALRGLIGQADPGHAPGPATLRGRADALSLLTALPGASDGQPLPVEATLLASGGQLLLRWTPYRHVERFGPAPRPQEMVLLSGVSGLQLSYFAPGGSGWSSNWSAAGLPSLVRVQIAFSAPSRHWPPIVAATRREAVEQ